MTAFFYVLSAVASLLIGIVLLLMFVRAILSWLPLDEGSAFSEFLFVTTEPFIIPVRAILERFESVRSLPIDISYLVTMLLLSFLRAIL